MPKQMSLTLPLGTVVPNHVAVILDGNRRWARARGLAPSDGHKAGYKALKGVIDASRQLGIHTFTIWGFSTENWDRPEPEVGKIMRLVGRAIQEMSDEAMREGVRLVHLGRKDRIPRQLADLITKVEKKTHNNKKHILNLALDYGGRDEILRAVKKVIADGRVSSRI